MREILRLHYYAKGLFGDILGHKTSVIRHVSRWKSKVCAGGKTPSDLADGARRQEKTQWLARSISIWVLLHRQDKRDYVVF